MIDQTLLPNEEKTLHCATVEQVCDAIRRLSVRGAPAIGCAAALAMALCAARSEAATIASLRSELMRAAGIPYRELEDEHGLLFPVIEVGARYRSEVLARGYSRDAIEHLRAFLGREPSPDAYLRDLGLKP
jgi:hypothetical protein